MIPSKLDIEKAKEYYRLFKGGEPNIIAPYLGGLGNVVVRLDDIVVRLKKENHLCFYDQNNERIALYETSLASLSPEIIFFDITNFAIVYRHFDGHPYLTKDTSERELIKAGLFIKMLHSLPTNGLKPFDAKKRFDVYRYFANVPSPFDQEKKLRERIETNISSEKMVFSHNDIVRGNLLEENERGKLSLIDFEYAGTNNEMFDIASLLSENSIEKLEQKKAFLLGYFENVTDLHLKKCNDYILYEDLLWYYWAIAKYRDSRDDSFLSIAKEKKEAIRLHSVFFED